VIWSGCRRCPRSVGDRCFYLGRGALRLTLATSLRLVPALLLRSSLPSDLARGQLLIDPALSLFTALPLAMSCGHLLVAPVASVRVLAAKGSLRGLTLPLLGCGLPRSSPLGLRATVLLQCGHSTRLVVPALHRGVSLGLQLVATLLLLAVTGLPLGQEPLVSRPLRSGLLL
jgi:hypothetical protein